MAMMLCSQFGRSIKLKVHTLKIAYTCMSTVNPRVDIAFKKIFGVEENKDLLISLVNSVVSEQDQIAQVTLLSPYNPKNFSTDKLSIVDIKAKSESGKRYNIEIQVADHADYDKRALYYWAKMYTEQLEEKSVYRDLNKTIGIHILNFLSVPDTSKYHNVFQLKEIESGLQYFNDIELHTLELKKFSDNRKELLTDIMRKVKTSLDMWLVFLTHNDLLHKDNLPKELHNKDLQKALTVLEHMNFSKEERSSYEDNLKWLRNEASANKDIAEAQAKIAKMTAEAEAKIAKMTAEADAKIAKMTAEVDAKIAAADAKIVAAEAKIIAGFAKNLLLEGMNIHTIRRVTGLTAEEIEKLKPEIEEQT